MTDFSIQFVDSIDDIGKQRWNALFGIDYPFLRYEFIAALEHTGCTSKVTGWQPHHLVVKQQQKIIVLLTCAII